MGLPTLETIMPEQIETTNRDKNDDKTMNKNNGQE